MMLFRKFLVTAVALAILFLYCFSNCDFAGSLATLSHVSWVEKSFSGFFAFQTPAWIGADYFFGNTWQQVLP